MINSTSTCSWTARGGFFAFSSTTYFESEEQVIPALLHAAKGRLLSSLRASPVYYDSLVRLTADTDAPEYLRVVATYSNWRTAAQAGQRSSESDEHGTDKHRVIWLLSLPELQELVVVEGPARPAEGAAEEHGGSAKRTALGDNSFWERGSLHVIVSAPKSHNYSWRMTIAPAAPKGGEYLAIVLDWCGDQLFQHAALLKAARAETNVLGVITPLFRILKPQPGPRPGHDNVFVGLLEDAVVKKLRRSEASSSRTTSGQCSRTSTRAQAACRRSTRTLAPGRRCWRGSCSRPSCRTSARGTFPL